MRERLLAIGDDFWIEDEHGERAFRVDGKALRVRDTLVFEDADGHELARIQERKARVRDSMEIEDPEGGRIAMVKKALVSPLRDRFEVEVDDGEDLSVHGNIVDHEYAIEQGGAKVAEVSKRWFRVRETYGVEVDPGHDDALILAVTVCIDQMTRDD
ncbi:MAG: LURP-one-related family protein [Thermoleophilia bacterium]|jgi:uncharacterized protein YxjI|nr:LURP-one-related family protein [Thermoleophilia bacterium]